MTAFRCAVVGNPAPDSRPLSLAHRLLVRAGALLRRRRSQFLQAHGTAFLQRILNACRVAEVEPFLMYGTLLGFHRDGGFIEGDSDIDLGLLARDLGRLEQLKSAMRRDGMALKHETYIDGRLWEVGFLHDQVDLWVDFAIVHIDGDQAMTRCCWGNDESLESHIYPADLLCAFTTRSWHGELVRVPERTEALLRSLYGEWQVPAPAFDYRTDYANAIITHYVSPRRTRLRLQVERLRRLPRIAKLLVATTHEPSVREPAD